MDADIAQQLVHHAEKSTEVLYSVIEDLRELSLRTGDLALEIEYRSPLRAYGARANPLKTRSRTWAMGLRRT